MFAGIVEMKQSVLAVNEKGKCKGVRIAKPRSWKLSVGESISVDGICSTVVAKGAAYFDVEYMPETLGKTTARQFAAGRVVNLERSLKYGGRLHGHFVAGHVDTRARVLGVQKSGRSRLVSIALPRELSKFVVPRGSVAVNGVSLTVACKRGGAFAVALIPHTLTATNLGVLKKSDAVNVECDMLARYDRSARVSAHAAKRSKKKPKR